MINIKTMDVEGFGPIVKQTFDWDLPGLNIIQAPNGHGKTKFINALVWCLYGKTLSGSVEPWAHVRPSSYRGTRVSLEVSIDNTNYRIIRFKDFPKYKNSLILSEFEGEPEPGDKKEVQAKIENLLGYTFDLFKNSIIFGQKLQRIISEKGPNKKKVFDDAFNISYIAKAKKFAEDELSMARSDLARQNHKYEIIENKISSKESEIQSQRNLIENFEGQKKIEIHEIKGKINKLRNTKSELRPVKELEKEISEIDHELEIFEKDAYDQATILRKEKELTAIESKVDVLKDKKDEVKKKIEKLEGDIENMPTACGNCGKPYTAIERKQAKKVLQGYLKEHQDNILSLDTSISATNGQISELQEDISSANLLLESIDSLNEDKKVLEDAIDTHLDYKDKIDKHLKEITKIKAKKLENKIEELSIELTDLMSQLKAQKKNVIQVKNHVKIYEWVIKDPLSNSGLKSFIFNMMLDDINERLEYYTRFIGFQVGFVMDMNSAHKNLETYILRGDDPVPYDDLSGGQQQAVDIVTAFAIHDVVSDTKNCSLLVLDEVFESLDRDNIEIITELIQDKASTKNLYLVTHRAEFNPTNANIIQIDFSEGVTSLN